MTSKEKLEILINENKNLLEEHLLYQKCFREIDLILYRLRFVDFTNCKPKDFWYVISRMLNDIRSICQNPLNVEKIIKGDDKDED